MFLLTTLSCVYFKRIPVFTHAKAKTRYKENHMHYSKCKAIKIEYRAELYQMVQLNT